VRSVSDERVYGPRWIGRTHGYVSYSGIAADELEAVSEADQRRQTSIARRREQQRLTSAWARAKPQILDGLDLVRRDARGAIPRRVEEGLRHLARDVDRLDHAFRGEP
jgi:hypothetical protein